MVFTYFEQQIEIESLDYYNSLALPVLIVLVSVTVAHGAIPIAVRVKVALPVVISAALGV